MEDYGGIIGLVIAIGFGIYSFITKAREQREGKQTPQEAWPSWDPDETEPDQHRSSESITNPEEEEYSDFSIEKQPSTRHQTTFTTTKTSFTIQQASHQESAQEFTYDFAQEEVGDAHGDEIAADELTSEHEGKSEGVAIDFDLRQAVIYSEILKPKFEE